MSLKHTYYDKRSRFWNHYWDKASEYEEYITQAESNHQEKWRDSEARIPNLTNDQLKRLQGYNRELNVLFYSGVWCGDCSRQGPLLKKIADACGEKVKIRFIERNTSEELQDELRIVGALRVPMVVFLSEDFWEVTRQGERTLIVYRAKAAREIGADFEKGILTTKARQTELSEWVDEFERVLIMLRLSPPLRRRYND